MEEKEWKGQRLVFVKINVCGAAYRSIGGGAHPGRFLYSGLRQL